MHTIVAFQPMKSQPPIPRRARPERLRALPQFSAIVHWLCSAVLQRQGDTVQVLLAENIPPVLLDKVEEEAVRTLAMLDPCVESVARRRARQAAGELLAKTVAGATDVELQDTAFLEDRGNAIADAVLARYRTQLVYGVVAPEARN